MSKLMGAFIHVTNAKRHVLNNSTLYETIMDMAFNSACSEQLQHLICVACDLNHLALRELRHAEEVEHG